MIFLHAQYNESLATSSALNNNFLVKVYAFVDKTRLSVIKKLFIVVINMSYSSALFQGFQFLKQLTQICLLLYLLPNSPNLIIIVRRFKEITGKTGF